MAAQFVAGEFDELETRDLTVDGNDDLRLAAGILVANID